MDFFLILTILGLATAASIPGGERGHDSRWVADESLLTSRDSGRDANLNAEASLPDPDTDPNDHSRSEHGDDEVAPDPNDPDQIYHETFGDMEKPVLKQSVDDETQSEVKFLHANTGDTLNTDNDATASEDTDPNETEDREQSFDDGRRRKFNTMKTVDNGDNMTTETPVKSNTDDAVTEKKDDEIQRPDDSTTDMRQSFDTTPSSVVEVRTPKESSSDAPMNTPAAIDTAHEDHDDELPIETTKETSVVTDSDGVDKAKSEVDINLPISETTTNIKQNSTDSLVKEGDDNEVDTTESEHITVSPVVQGEPEDSGSSSVDQTTKTSPDRHTTEPVEAQSSEKPTDRTATEIPENDLDKSNISDEESTTPEPATIGEDKNKSTEEVQTNSADDSGDTTTVAVRDSIISTGSFIIPDKESVVQPETEPPFVTAIPEGIVTSDTTTTKLFPTVKIYPTHAEPNVSATLDEREKVIEAETGVDVEAKPDFEQVTTMPTEAQTIIVYPTHAVESKPTERPEVHWGEPDDDKKPSEQPEQPTDTGSTVGPIAYPESEISTNDTLHFGGHEHHHEDSSHTDHGASPSTEDIMDSPTTESPLHNEIDPEWITKKPKVQEPIGNVDDTVVDERNMKTKEKSNPDAPSVEPKKGPSTFTIVAITIPIILVMVAILACGWEYRRNRNHRSSRLSLLNRVEVVPKETSGSSLAEYSNNNFDNNLTDEVIGSHKRKLSIRKQELTPSDVTSGNDVISDSLMSSRRCRSDEIDLLDAEATFDVRNSTSLSPAGSLHSIASD